MTAPALVLLAHGAEDPRVHRMAAALRQHMQKLRPNLHVELCYDDDLGGSGLTVVKKLVTKGLDEVVLVPVDICRAMPADPAAEALITQLREAHPKVRCSIARPVGPATELLPILDERLRTALRVTRTVELDGLVLSVRSNGDVRGHALVSRRARQWAAHHRLPCVVAVADGTGPNVVQAITTLRSQGRRHIAVGSLFLADSEDFVQQSEQALAAGAVAVSGVLGPDDRILDLVMARYAYAAMGLLDPDEEDAEDDSTEHAEITELMAATKQ